MSFLISLWMPILLSAVVLFFASFVAWALLPHHKSEWLKLPDEEALSQSLRDQNIPAGQYLFPHCGDDPEYGKSKQFKDRENAGPNGTLMLWDGTLSMGKNMLCTFLFFLAASFCLAYLATIGIEPGASFLRVFRFVGTAGILTFAAAGIPNAIWFKRKMRNDLLDGIAYGLLTGLVFGLLWPASL